MPMGLLKLVVSVLGVQLSDGSDCADGIVDTCAEIASTMIQKEAVTFRKQGPITPQKLVKQMDAYCFFIERSQEIEDSFQEKAEQLKKTLHAAGQQAGQLVQGDEVKNLIDSFQEAVDSDRRLSPGLPVGQHRALGTHAQPDWGRSLSNSQFCVDGKLNKDWAEKVHEHFTE